MRSNASFVTTHSKETKPNLDTIFNYGKEKNPIISNDDYLAEIEKLESSGCIYKREGKNYYHVSDDYVVQTEMKVNDDVIYNKGDDKFFPKDMDIIEMIKENMLQEKLRDREYIEFLKEQIIFYQDELREKNNIIKTLLNQKVDEKRVETRLNGKTSIDGKLFMKRNVNDESKNSMDTCHKTTNYSVNDAVLEKKNIPNIEIIGDSHLNSINPKGLSKHNNVIVRNHPGSNTEDLKSYIVPSIKKKRNVLISGCNDLTSKVNTIGHLQFIINNIKKKSAHTKIAISSIFTRADKNGVDKQLKKLCEENLIDFITIKI